MLLLPRNVKVWGDYIKILYFIIFFLRVVEINQHLHVAALILPLSYVTFPAHLTAYSRGSGVNAVVLYEAYAHLIQMQYIILQRTNSQRIYSHQVWRKKTCTKWVIAANRGKWICVYTVTKILTSTRQTHIITDETGDVVMYASYAEKVEMSNIRTTTNK